jgi:uncharacterized membrane protein
MSLYILLGFGKGYLWMISVLETEAHGVFVHLDDCFYPGSVCHIVSSHTIRVCVCILPFEDSVSPLAFSIYL